MKIEYRTGDLFKTDIMTIMHGCNAKGIMGSGVAKLIRDKYPEAYNQYFKIGHEFGYRMGEIIIASCGDKINDSDNFKLIVNAITQERFGNDTIRYVSYDAIADAMNAVNKMYNTHQITEVAMPQIGAGLGGGNWNVIASIIESELTLVKPVVYIYK